MARHELVFACVIPCSSNRSSLRLAPRINSWTSITLVGIMLGIAGIRAHSQTGSLPIIRSVSPILAQPNQVITITGSGFGTATPYNGDSNHIYIWDGTQSWKAGYAGPGENDFVTLSVSSWTDTQIVIGGFTGAYGSNNWTLYPGDQITVAVWNNQSGSGPSQCNLIAGGMANNNCNPPTFLPNTAYFHGTEILSWTPAQGGLPPASANLTVSGAVDETLGNGLNPTSTLNWDTTTVPDGNYQIALTLLGANGNAVASVTKKILINNSVVWHSGTVQGSQRWTADKVHGIDGNLIIPSGVTVTIQPGTVVKVVPGVVITVQSGGILNALGSNTLPIVFTSIDDASHGGDTTFDGGTGVPSSAEWDGVTTQGTGQFNTNGDTTLLYWQAVQTGTLAGSETWSGSQLYHVTGNVTVPSGVTLTIQPGAIMKFDPNTGITIQSGGTLIANGTVAQPIYFTSIKDDSVGGDTNGDGNATLPAAGDWGSILINGASASFNHVQMSYGGGPASSSSNLIGMIQSNGSATVTISNSNIQYSFWDGILAGYPSGGDVVTVSSSILSGIEGRGVNAWSGSVAHVTNDTFDNNGVGVMAHGGSIDVENSIVANSKGIQGWGSVYDSAGGLSIAHSDVWSGIPGVPNYSGTDFTGSNGNISADPAFLNESQGNYRLNYGSPAIDAADGTVAYYSLTDIMGDPRYNDPEVPARTGIADKNGNFPDMGAYEFVQNAASNIDFTVTSVGGPSLAMAGDQVQVTWTVTNVGSGTAVGPWHDSVYLVRDPDTNPVELLAGQVLVGSGVVMGPGATYTTTATVRVPGSIVGNHRWQVKTNTAGDIFEGQNIANNTGRSLSLVAIDLPQLVVNGDNLSNSFTAAGQSWWYKVIPGAGNTVGANLKLTGNSGSVQLLVGQGYVPTPQQFDIQQQQWNSPSVSAAIPNTTTQIYYVTAYAQALPSTPAPFSISAVSQQFSLNSVQPNSMINAGAATIEFIGAELTANATYQIVGSGGTTYTASSVYASDSAHVYATFSGSGLPTGTYTAQVTENGATASLKNAITVSAGTAQPVTIGQIAYDIQVPDAVRAGYGGVVTINYTNTGSTDVAAPLMVLTATGATETFQPILRGFVVSPNFPTLYTTMVGQGQFLGINQTGGPVGVLPAGASGSVSMDFTAGTGNNIQFSLYTVTDPSATIDWASASASMQPPYISADAWSAIFANFTSSAGTTWGQYNARLANDATYLGQLGIQEYRVNQLQAFEFMKAGIDTIARRYYLGAFGRGASHPFDIWGETQGSGYLFHYPNGTVRVFVPNPNSAGQYIGGIGDYATLSFNSSDQSVLLTEKTGIVYHFLHDSSTSHVLFDYLQDLNGNRITATYTKGLVTTATGSSGDALTFTYDGNGRITQSTDPVGRVTNYLYDSADQHLLSITNSSGTINLAYVTGQGPAQEHALQSVTWQDGTHTNYGYDAQGRLTSIQKDGGAQAFTLAYSTTGVITVTDALGNTWQLSPDANGSLAQLGDPLGNLTRIFYDPEEKLVGTILPNGATTSLNYDTNGNPIEELDPLGNQITTLFAANGDLMGLTDALGNSTVYGYDSHFNATSIIYPDTRAVQATYDSRGNITSFTNRRGQKITYTYNDKNLLTQKVRSNGATVNYTYDGHRNLQSLTDSTGTTNFSYDSADRIQRVTYPNGRFVKYTCDSGGRRNSLSDQTGYTVSYSYDNVGRLSQITSGSGVLIASYTYDSDGRLSKKNLGNGAQSTYAYDAAGNVLHLVNYSSQGGSINSRFDYTYDANGRKSTMTTLNGSWQYGYDADGQLTSVAPPTTAAVQYTYDAAGNRLTMVSGTATTNYSINNLNQYTSVGGFTYSYDPDGNLISRQTSTGTWTYTWDDEGRLLTATGPSGNWTYQYDSLGNRISTVNGGTTTQYLVDPTGLGNVEGLFDGTGTLVSHFANGLGLESSVPASGSADFYQFDDSGNTATVTGAGGALTDSYSFLPFGEEVKSSVTVSNPFGYAGEFGVADDGNGLYYMRARYFDFVLGRFMSQDPVDLFAGDPNLYRYSSNNPLNVVDPDGKCPWCAVVIIGGGLGAYNASRNQQNPIVGFFAGAVGDLASLATDTPAVGSVVSDIISDIGNSAGKPCNNCGNIGTYLLDALIANGLGAILKPYKNSRFDPWNSKLRPGASGRSAQQLYLSTAAGDYMSDRPRGIICEIWPGLCQFLGMPWDPTQTANVPNEHSLDPNGKITVGYGDQGFMPADATITYTIYFENQSTATAPAVSVTVTDTLDPNLDPSTVKLSQISFNGVTLNMPGELQSYSAQSTVSTSPYPVTVSAGLDPTAGTLTWTMQSLDPTTGAAPADPLAGFLPPDNSSRHGEGSVTFTVKPKSGLANGTAIYNQASIVFDRNATISTNKVTNTIDSIYPTSSVDPLPATTSTVSFAVSWSGTDPAGAGIASYDIFTSTDHGPYTNWLAATPLTTSTFSGAYGHTYSFYSMATDNAGQRQRTPAPSQQTIVVQPTFTVSPSPASLSMGRNTSATDTISVAGKNGFIGAVNLTCTVSTTMTDVKDMPMCSLSPASITISGTTTQTSTLTVATGSSHADNRTKGLFWTSAGGAVPAFLIFFVTPTRRRTWLAITGAFLLFATWGTVGCGPSGGGGTTSGTYTVTVTGQSGTMTSPVAMISLTVQ